MKRVRLIANGNRYVEPTVDLNINLQPGFDDSFVGVYVNDKNVGCIDLTLTGLTFRSVPAGHPVLLLDNEEINRLANK